MSKAIVALALACLIVSLGASVIAQHWDIEAISSELSVAKETISGLERKLADANAAIKGYDAVASWYGPGFHGRKSADGSVYDQQAYTIAHKTLPFGTIVILEYKGRRVPAMVTDRGPYVPGRDFDLSLGLASRLGLMTKGVDEIKVYQIEVPK
jgi:rare lipoprotein A (peptidoglycan hydrolase)